MAIKRFEDVTNDVLKTVLSGLEAPAFGFQQYFPLEYTSSLTWESLSSDGNLSVAADVIAHDTSANLKSRPDTVSQTGKIQKIAILNRVTEKKLHDYFALQSNPRGLEDQIMRIIFGDVRRGYEGIHMRMEHLAMQALSSGVAETLDANNSGITTKATYAIPPANKKGTYGAVWTSGGTATPITDIRNVVELARGKGQRITSILMERSTFELLRNADETKALFSGYLGLNSGILAPTIDNINVVLGGEGLPSITLVDSQVNIESAAGVISNVSPWSVGKVTFMTSPTAGTTMWTQTAEEKAAQFAGTGSGLVTSNRDLVRITRWQETNPVAVLTKAEAVAFPVLNNVKGIFMLNTLNATTWS